MILQMMVILIYLVLMTIGKLKAIIFRQESVEVEFNHA